MFSMPVPWHNIYCKAHCFDGCKKKNNLVKIQRGLRTNNPHKSQKQRSYGNCSHFWEVFDQFVEKCWNISSKYDPIYSKIHRIRIRYSKHQCIIQITPTTPKHLKNNTFEHFETVRNEINKYKNSTFYFTTCVNYILRIMYVLYVVNFVILYILYLYIYIYIYTRTRGGLTDRSRFWLLQRSHKKHQTWAVVFRCRSTKGATAAWWSGQTGNVQQRRSSTPQSTSV